MSPIKRSILLVFYLLLFSCSETEEPKSLGTLSTIEAGEDNSYANIYSVRTKHLHLDLDVNFENKSIYGIARHEIENNHADTAIFDVKGLLIQKVTLGKKGNEKNTSYVIGIEDSINGAPLSVLITPKTRYINIYYQTTEQTTSLHWEIKSTQRKTLVSDTSEIDTTLVKNETPNFVFTLPGEKFIRNWIPLQDIGYKKINYSADIRVPEGLLPLMGTSNPTKLNDSSIYHFSSTFPIPVYEIGITIGNFKYQRLAKKQGVYFLDKINKSILRETKTLPNIQRSIEKTYGKSPWPVTNFIILPASSTYHSYTYSCNYYLHPSIFSKYENSTFDLTYFLLSNWPATFFSNTCKNNKSLEKGIAMYYLHRLVLKNYGKLQSELASKFYINSCLLSQHGDFSPDYLPKNVYTNNCNEKTTIQTKEIAFKQLKGYLLMKALESSLNMDKTDRFVKNYLHENQAHTLADFEHELNHYLIQEEIIHFPLKTWLYSKKIPPFTYKISSKRHLQIHILVKSFLGNKKFFRLRKTKATFNHFTPFDWLTFISLLPPATNIKKLAQLDTQFHLSQHPNRNIQIAWLRYGKRNNYKSVEIPLQQLLTLYNDKNLHEYFK